MICAKAMGIEEPDEEPVRTYAMVIDGICARGIARLTWQSKVCSNEACVQGNAHVTR